MVQLWSRGGAVTVPERGIGEFHIYDVVRGNLRGNGPVMAQ